MNGFMIQDYIKLTEFFGRVLGPDFEVALHDLSDLNHTIIAIANGHISGRTVGAPISEAAKQMITENSQKKESYRFNFGGISSINSRMLRSSVFFIWDDDGSLWGLLCINYDDSRYRDLSERILKLRPMGTASEGTFVYDKNRSVRQTMLQQGAESFQSSILSMTENAVNTVVGQSNVPTERLTLNEKMKIIGLLEEKGVFMLKGAVKLVAEQLSCSQASVYRYLNRVSNEKQIS